MEKKRFFTLKNVVYLFATVFYIAIAVWAFTISADDFSNKRMLLAFLIILSSVPHILIFVVNRKKISYLVIGLVGTALGIVFLTTGDLFSADQICMIWGCLDICRGTTEIINRVPEVKHYKGELFEIAISTGDIIIGVLLCIHMAHGLQLHLIYLGIAFVLSALKNINDLILERIENAKSTDSN